MKDTGVTRRVDELGRIVIPIEIRRTLDISERDLLEISVSDDCILLRKNQVSCVFCGGSKNISRFRGKNICSSCIAAIKAN